MKVFDRKKPLSSEFFDRVMIKSANHEIPSDAQHQLYEAVYDVLKPGGKFVNLGFTFTDRQERDEFREIARTKDTLAGMHEAAENRHFLLRSELYSLLRQSGFTRITNVHSFDYTIESSAVSEHYFDDEQQDIEHQVAQCRARTLRRNGRIRFLRDRSVMRCPGEITVAEKPDNSLLNLRTFRAYPYDFVRKISAHEQMINRAVSHIPANSKVLDLACGIGLLAERLTQHVQFYQGFDISRDFIGVARERYGELPGFRFDVADLHRITLERGTYDAVTILNALYLPGLNAPLILAKSLDALRPGGRLIISGPLTPRSFLQAVPHIRKQLEDDGYLPEHEATFAAIVEANRRLLTQHGNYWSLEGLITLLKSLGFGSVVTVSSELYYGSSYFIVIEKPD